MDRKKRVLIVDDEPIVIQSLYYFLKDRYELLPISFGKAAVEYVKTDDIDIVILDYILPDSTGIDVLRMIKSIKPFIPVIIITAYGNEEVAIDALRFGATDYVKKPLNFHDLLNRIEFYTSIRAYKGEQGYIFLDETLNSPTSNDNFCRIHRAVKYTENNCVTKLSLGEVAKEACMSKYHFSRTFKKVMGISYKDHLNKLRIERAKNLLKNSSLTITDIAFSVGYVDITHFERIFKKITGHTPSHYRTILRSQDPKYMRKAI
ncbi:MAG: helix-turn-helix domain-containing protein [Nitrospirota bacterium]